MQAFAWSFERKEEEKMGSVRKVIEIFASSYSLLIALCYKKRDVKKRKLWTVLFFLDSEFT